MHQLTAALCLLLVIEGLVLFAAPKRWQAMMREALKLPPRPCGCSVPVRWSSD